MRERLVPSCALAALACALLAGCAREPARPNVLLIVVDTLRFDRLGVHGSARGLTPNIDRLARESLCFTHAQSPRAKTTPTMVSIFTGLYPHEHGVRDLAAPLERGLPTLAEGLRAAGYATGAIVGNYVLRDDLAGLARGFELWVEDLPDRSGVPPDDVPQRRARSLTDGALAALGLGPPSADGAGPHTRLADGERPWFLWLHYMDPHGVYDAPAEHRVEGRTRPEPIPPPADPPDPIHRRWIAEYNVLAEDRLSDGSIDAALVRDRYDAEVRYVDAEIGRLLDAMRQSGLLDHTLVVLTADHGESLGEHDYWFEHGLYTYEVTCRVPLLLRFPARMRQRPEPGLRTGDVSLVDLAPTLCEILRVPPLPRRGKAPDGATGRSFTHLFEREPDARRAVFSEKLEGAGRAGTIQAKAVRIGDWKLIHRFAEVEQHPGGHTLRLLSEQLFDLTRDPYETRDLAKHPPAAAPLERLRAELLEFTARDVHFAELARILAEQRAELGRRDPDALRALRSLGY